MKPQDNLEYTSIGVDGMGVVRGLVYIHPNALQEKQSGEVIELLHFLRYETTSLSHMLDKADWIVDTRSVDWRGWRSVSAAFECKHYSDMVMWNRARKTKPVALLDKEDNECYT